MASKMMVRMPLISRRNGYEIQLSEQVFELESCTPTFKTSHQVEAQV